MHKPALVGIVLLLATAGVGFTLARRGENKPSSAAGAPAARETRTVSVTARQWAFEPATITVRQGRRVRLSITSVDVAHGIALPDFGVSAILTPGHTTEVEFVANRTGRFPFFCNVQCGEGHGAMRGTLVVN